MSDEIKELRRQTSKSSSEDLKSPSIDRKALYSPTENKRIISNELKVLKEPRKSKSTTPTDGEKALSSCVKICKPFKSLAQLSEERLAWSEEEDSLLKTPNEEDTLKTLISPMLPKPLMSINFKRKFTVKNDTEKNGKTSDSIVKSKTTTLSKKAAENATTKPYSDGIIENKNKPKSLSNEKVMAADKSISKTFDEVLASIQPLNDHVTFNSDKDISKSASNDAEKKIESSIEPLLTECEKHSGNSVLPSVANKPDADMRILDMDISAEDEEEFWSYALTMNENAESANERDSDLGVFFTSRSEKYEHYIGTASKKKVQVDGDMNSKLVNNAVNRYGNAIPNLMDLKVTTPPEVYHPNYHPNYHPLYHPIYHPVPVTTDGRRFFRDVSYSDVSRKSCYESESIMKVHNKPDSIHFFDVDGDNEICPASIVAVDNNDEKAVGDAANTTLSDTSNKDVRVTETCDSFNASVLIKCVPSIVSEDNILQEEGTNEVSTSLEDTSSTVDETNVETSTGATGTDKQSDRVNPKDDQITAKNEVVSNPIVVDETNRSEITNHIPVEGKASSKKIMKNIKTKETVLKNANESTNAIIDRNMTEGDAQKNQSPINEKSLKVPSIKPKATSNIPSDKIATTDETNQTVTASTICNADNVHNDTPHYSSIPSIKSSSELKWKLQLNSNGSSVVSSLAPSAEPKLTLHCNPPPDGSVGRKDTFQKKPIEPKSSLNLHYRSNDETKMPSLDATSNEESNTDNVHENIVDVPCTSQSKMKSALYLDLRSPNESKIPSPDPTLNEDSHTLGMQNVVENEPRTPRENLTSTLQFEPVTPCSDFDDDATFDGCSLVSRFNRMLDTISVEDVVVPDDATDDDLSHPLSPWESHIVNTRYSRTKLLDVVSIETFFLDKDDNCNPVTVDRYFDVDYLIPSSNPDTPMVEDIGFSESFGGLPYSTYVTPVTSTDDDFAEHSKSRFYHSLSERETNANISDQSNSRYERDTCPSDSNSITIDKLRNIIELVTRNESVVVYKTTNDKRSNEKIRAGDKLSGENKLLNDNVNNEDMSKEISKALQEFCEDVKRKKNANSSNISGQFKPGQIVKTKNQKTKKSARVVVKDLMKSKHPKEAKNGVAEEAKIPSEKEIATASKRNKPLNIESKTVKAVDDKKTADKEKETEEKLVKSGPIETDKVTKERTQGDGGLFEKRKKQKIEGMPKVKTARLGAVSGVVVIEKQKLKEKSLRKDFTVNRVPGIIPPEGFEIQATLKSTTPKQEVVKPQPCEAPNNTVTKKTLPSEGVKAEKSLDKKKMEIISGKEQLKEEDAKNNDKNRKDTKNTVSNDEQKLKNNNEKTYKLISKNSDAPKNKSTTKSLIEGAELPLQKKKKKKGDSVDNSTEKKSGLMKHDAVRAEVLTKNQELGKVSLEKKKTNKSKTSEVRKDEKQPAVQENKDVVEIDNEEKEREISTKVVKEIVEEKGILSNGLKDEKYLDKKKNDMTLVSQEGYKQHEKKKKKKQVETTAEVSVQSKKENLIKKNKIEATASSNVGKNNEITKQEKSEAQASIKSKKINHKAGKTENLLEETQKNDDKATNNEKVANESVNAEIPPQVKEKMKKTKDSSNQPVNTKVVKKKAMIEVVVAEIEKKTEEVSMPETDVNQLTKKVKKKKLETKTIVSATISKEKHESTQIKTTVEKHPAEVNSNDKEKIPSDLNQNENVKPVVKQAAYTAATDPHIEDLLKTKRKHDEDLQVEERAKKMCLSANTSTKRVNVGSTNGSLKEIKNKKKRKTPEETNNVNTKHFKKKKTAPTPTNDEVEIICDDSDLKQEESQQQQQQSKSKPRSQSCYASSPTGVITLVEPMVSHMCKQCNERFSCEEDLVHHKISHTVDASAENHAKISGRHLKCNACARLFKKDVHLKNHIKLFHRGKCFYVFWLSVFLTS